MCKLAVVITLLVGLLGVGSVVYGDTVQYVNVTPPPVSTDGSNLIIQNVWCTPFNGPLDLVIPWKGVSAGTYLDLLHFPNNTLVGVEGPIFKIAIPQWNDILVGDLIVASIVAGPINKGMLGGSLNLQNTNANVTNNWKVKPWIGSCADGQGLYGGFELFDQFK